MNSKTPFVALLAILFGVALSTPAAAAADYHFLDEGEPIGGEPSGLTFAGPVDFTNESYGVACGEAHATVSIATTAADITSFVPTECETTGLLPAFGCELTAPDAATATGLPWTIAPVSTSELTLSAFAIDFPLEPCFPFGEGISAESTGEYEVSLIPTKAGEIGELNLSGSLTTQFGYFVVDGSLTPEADGTISLAET